jgi:endonuclease/exonuclease/phosphatase (EEP) superfamily protein YafD
MFRLLLLAVLLPMFGCAARPTRVAADVPPDVPRLNVLTYNVNFALAGDGPTLAAVAQADGDVVCLQETTPEWESVLRANLARQFPHMEFKHWPGAGGLGLLSKFPIESVEYLPPVSWFPAARVVLETPLGRVQMLNVHLRPPIGDSGGVVSGYFSTPPVRRSEIAHFAASLDPSLPALVVGDFNEEEGGRALGWLRRRGIRSALPEFSPGAKTWRWRTSLITLRGRYDHLCYDRRLRPLRVEVRPAGRSDHLPVFGTFTLAEGVAPVD